MRKFFLAVTVSFCFGFLPSFSQPNTAVSIKGKVVDKTSGGSVANVSVRIKNSGTGVSTDAAGNFRLTTSSLPATLIITHSTYEQTEEVVNNTEEVAVRLTPSLVMLDGVFLSSKGIPTRILDAAFSAELIDYKKIEIKTFCELITQYNSIRFIQSPKRILFICVFSAK